LEQLDATTNPWSTAYDARLTFDRVPFLGDRLGYLMLKKQTSSLLMRVKLNGYYSANCKRFYSKPDNLAESLEAASLMTISCPAMDGLESAR